MIISAYGGMEFPEKLEKAIAKSGKTQSLLAEETGIGQSAISAMTRGARRPYLDQAFRLARAVGVSCDYLADDSLDDVPDPAPTLIERALIAVIRAKSLDLEEAIRRLEYAPAREPVVGHSVEQQSKKKGTA